MVTARDADQLGGSDLNQLTYGATNIHILLSHNRNDFERLHRDWLNSAKEHAGIIIARRRLPPDLAARIGRLLTKFDMIDFRDQLFYV